MIGPRARVAIALAFFTYVVFVRTYAASFVCVRAGGGGQRGGGRRDLGGELVQVRLNRGVTRGELLLVRVEERHVLLQDKHMLGPIVAGQGGDDLRCRRSTAIVAMLRQVMGIAVTRHDVAQDPQARHAGDVADDEG